MTAWRGRVYRKLHKTIVVAAVAAMYLPLAAQGTGELFWPQWRGPHASGVSRSATPPIEWGEGKNIRWKIDLPGRGASTPVIWGDRVYVSTAVPVGGTGARAQHRFLVMAVNRQDGKVVWQHTAREEAPHEGTHQEFGTMASASAVTDGQHVIASFESRGIYALDMNGKLVWQKDLGDKTMRNEFGEGSSPALYKDKLFIVWDHQGESFIVALNKATGAVVWETGGLTMNPIPSPVSADGLVFLMSGFRGNSLKAIQFGDAKGDITGTPNVVWSLDRDTPYVPSPLLYDGVLYFLKSNNGLLSAFEAKTGKPLYQAQRIDALPSVFASPVGAAGRVYLVGQQGTAVVLKHGPSLEVLATNTLKDKFDASPALVDREMYLRGYENLYCVAEK
jgi:outer membrane protein assembly factor BamB